MGLEGRRVLVVEDEFLLAREMATELKRLGAVIAGPEPSVSGALARLDSEAIDLAVLDVNLGDEKVFPVADRLADAGTPFLFVTGYEHELLPDRFAQVLWCGKPMMRAELKTALNRLLADAPHAPSASAGARQFAVPGPGLDEVALPASVLPGPQPPAAGVIDAGCPPS